jgi:hypothetical protein
MNVDALIQIPIWIILIYIPFLCWLDIKYREVPYLTWVPLIAVNLPITAYLYYYGWYPTYALAFSLIMIGIFWFLMVKKFIHGADFIFLSIISLFFVVNPYPLPHGIMQISFYFYLIAVLLFTAVVVLIGNYRGGYRSNLWVMMSRWDRGLPFMIPISIAFIITVMFG